MIVVALKGEFARRCQRETGQRLQFFHERCQADAVNGVLQPCIATFIAVAQVALQYHHCFNCSNDLFGRHKAHHAAHARVGGGVAV